VIAAVASFAALAVTGTGGPALASTPATGASVPFSSAAERQLALLGEAAPGAPGAPGPATGTTASSNLPRELVVPDVLAVIPTGIPGTDVARIRKLPGVRGVLTVSGGAIRIGGKPANVIGVTPQQFRSWTPPSAAGDQALWQVLAHGSFITSNAAKSRLGLTSGQSYAVTAASQSQVAFGGSANLSIPGVDAVVSNAVAARLGLVKNLGVLINAPADDFSSLVSKVRAVTGAQGQVVSLQPTTSTTPGQLPVATSVPTGRPTTYLALYQESAARYCPGLSWTVLAAIGEVESGDGTNMGPSSAGALGPMQFLPSTWQRWGITGFGDTGTPNIMNPFDAVPSAAEYLCAAGAAKGGSSLYQAIFAYNHADWYVSEVLAIAREYAQSGG
jgi:hypothetical protein